MSVRTRWAVLFLLTLFWLATAESAPFSADFRISATTLSLNEPLEVTLTLQYPANYQISPGMLRDHLLQAPFTLVNESIPPGALEDSRMTQTLRYSLEPQKTGQFWISFFTVSFYPKSGTPGKTVRLIVAGKPIVVVPVSAPRQPLPYADFAPLMQQLPMSLDRASQLLLFLNQELEPDRNQQIIESHAFPWHMVAVMATLFALACGLVVSVRYFRRSKAIDMAAHRPLKTAIQRLDELDQRSLGLTRDFESFFVELTGVIRQYVEERTGIPAREETTPEFLERTIQSQCFSTQECQLLADLLTYADQVKFANKPSTMADCQMAAAYAREFLERKGQTTKI
jgi:hypothetical protein